AYRNIGQQFLFQTIPKVSRGDIRTFTPGERGRVDRENHRDRRLVDLDARERLWIVGARNRVADVNSFNSGDCEDIARLADGFIHTLQSFKGIELGDFCPLKRTIEFQNPDIVTQVQSPIEYASDRQTAEVVAVIEIGN